MVRGNDRQHGIFEIKRLETLFAQIQTYDWGRVGGSDKNKFINHKLGLEIWVGRQSVIKKHDCQQLPFHQSWQKKMSSSPALYSSTFCYLAQGIAIFFSYIYKIKRWWGPITLQGNAGRAINVGLESFTSNQNLKFPVMCRWQEGSRWLLVMEQGQFLFRGFSHYPWLSCSDSLLFHYLVQRTSWPKHMALWEGTGVGCWVEDELWGSRANRSIMILHCICICLKIYQVFSHSIFHWMLKILYKVSSTVLFSSIYKWENWDSKAPKSLPITLLFFWSLNPYSNMLPLLRDTP